MKKITVILLVCLINSLVFPQAIGDWQTYTDMKSVTAIQATADGFWAASSGGAFFYNKDDHSYKTLRKSNGLTGALLNAVTVDKNGNVWFGSQEGIIDIYNPEDNSVQPFLDIYLAKYVDPKKINELTSSGDTIIVSTDYGITLINSGKLITYDTFVRLGSIPSNIRVNSTLKSGKIYAATDYGVAIQNGNSWSVYQMADGLPSDKIQKIIKYQGSIIAASDKGLSYFDGNKWNPFLPEFNNTNVEDLLIANDTLFIISNNSVDAYYNGAVSNYFSASDPLTKLSYSNSLGLLTGSSLGVIEGKNINSFYPNGPAANQFLGIDIDNSGNLWCATGTDVSGIGFYKYDGQVWTNYNKTNTPQIQTNSYFTVKTFGNEVLFGSWGNGFLSVTDNTYKVFNTTNTDMKGIQTGPSFLVITDFAKDSKGNLWILNYGAADRKILAMLKPSDSTWYYFSIPAFSNQYIQQNLGMVIDQYDTKWFYSKDGNKPGLFYFNENGTYTDPSDDISGYINNSNGLNDNIVNSILVDKRGDIWVGTGLGINIISNNGSVLASKPALSFESVFNLRQLSINCMAVDPINQKWIGTNQGLLLINSDGTSSPITYDSKNSPLPSDVIRSITVDENNGKIYVATDAAITSFKTPAIKPQDSFTNLFVYPSPFILNGKNDQLTISGLVVDSDIKIVSITGKLITEFSSPGGNIAFWNGKDMNGNYVSSGVYLVIAFDKEGNNTVVGKVAVIKE